jgi:hypothetical protein
MSLPHTNITPIPNNDPQASPELWNTRYTEIDQDFANLDERTLSVEDEIIASIYGNLKLALIIGRIISQIGGLKRILNGTATLNRPGFSRDFLVWVRLH